MNPINHPLSIADLLCSASMLGAVGDVDLVGLHSRILHSKSGSDTNSA